MDITKLSVADAKLVQLGLKAAGYYNGTTRGVPGPKTKAAYDKWTSDNTPGKGADLSDSDTFAEKLIALARKEVGVLEVPRNSNRGKRVEEYQATTWLEGSGWPWCAAFICWLCKEAGVPNRPTTPGAYDFERWARKKSTPAKLYKSASSRVKAGDIVVFTFSHIALAIEDEVGGYVKTIEGNTNGAGSREGNGVYIKQRSRRKIRSHIRLQG